MDRAQLQRPQTAIHLGFPYSYGTGWREVSPLKERVIASGTLTARLWTGASEQQRARHWSARVKRCQVSLLDRDSQAMSTPGSPPIRGWPGSIVTGAL